MESRSGAVEPESRMICSRCSAVDIMSFLRTKVGYNGEVIKQLDRWKESVSCSMCAFYMDCLPFPHSRDPAITDAFLLRREVDSVAYPRLGVTGRILPPSPVDNCLSLVHLDSPFRITRPTSTMMLIPSNIWHTIQPIPPRVDLAMVTRWLSRSRIATRQGAQRRTKMFPMSIRQQSLTVIDCVTLKLVPLPEEAAYVTLSYVWGSFLECNSPDAIEGRLPFPLPQTIEDSITVCKWLEHRYLWIDRFCIPRDDHSLRAQQIQNMDAVYRDSSVTLIACAGDNPDYGLPGVSRSRVRNPSLSLQDNGYLQLIPNVNDIYSSTWATRGWTYQEALLARSCLYFTDRQVYFESSDLVECELTSGAPIRNFLLPSPIYSLSRQLASKCDFYQNIGDYSERQLTFPEDTLNAFLGILAFGEMHLSIRHLWGLPFSTDTPPSSRSAPHVDRLIFEESLRWYIPAGGIRRRDFPSWSWTGWAGRVRWSLSRSQHNLLAGSNQSGLMKVSVELTSGELLSWENFQQRYPDLNRKSYTTLSEATSYKLSPFLVIETLTTPLMYLRDGSKARIGFVSTDGLPIPSLGNARIDTLVEGLSSDTVDDYLLLHFNSYENEVVDRPASALLVCSVGRHWERLLTVEFVPGIVERLVKVHRKIRLG